MALPSLQCSQEVPLQSFASPKLTSPFASSSSLTKRTQKNPIVLCRFAVSGPRAPTKLLKSSSFNKPISRGHTMKRACSLNFDDEFFHEDLSEQFYELVQGSEPSEDEEDHGEYTNNTTTRTISVLGSEHRSNMSKFESLEPFMFGIQPEPPEWPEREEVMRAIIERRASRVDLPLSLRMIKKKQKWLGGFGGFGVSPCCSVNKAFSSMVFTILEIQSYALRMREVISYEDLEGIIARVNRELYASFAWLFQQVFSQTPSLMINVMILLTDFSVHAMANNSAIQDNSLPVTLCEATEKVSAMESRNQNQFDSSALKSFSSKNCAGWSSSHSIQYPDGVPDDISRFPSNEDHKFGQNDLGLWSTVMDEAIMMQGEVVDHHMMESFVSPVSAEIEPDDYMEYYRTDLLYQMGLSQDPNNSLLLCNYAQFLHLVAHDYDRAEECFKRAIQVEPSDAEALSQYANFLWIVRKDLWGAEERYLQAIAAEPESPFHVSKYANFLWSSGGEETCFPLNTS